MTYTYIVNPETGEILFDLVHDLITQNIRAIKIIAKKLNAVLRQKREKMSINFEEIESIVVETDEKNSIPIATITADTVKPEQGYRVRIKPKIKNQPLGGNGSLP